MKHPREGAARSSFRSNTLPQWRLDNLFAHPDRDIPRLTRQLSADVKTFEACRKRLTSAISNKAFLHCLKSLADLTTISSKLQAYAQLRFAQDTTDQATRSLLAQVREHVTQLSNRLLFFDLWWQRVSERDTKRLLSCSGDYRYHLETVKRQKQHTLSEPEERILNLKNTTGRGALDDLYNITTNAMTFSIRDRVRRPAVTREELSTYFRHPSARMREAAYQELFRVYAAQRDVLGEIYKFRVLDWKIEGLDLRKYPSPIGVRNFANDIPDAAVHTLLHVCRKNAWIFQDYFRLKAAIHKIKRFSRFDLYAPAKVRAVHYPFAEAVKLVLAAYRRFSPLLADHIQSVLHEQHIDAQPRPGKMGGAFCYSVTPRMIPFVHLNYHGEPRDIATLAHELGHAVHSILARNHSIFTFHPTLPLAETASVFGEQLLSDVLLHQESHPKNRQSLLLAQIDDLYATIVRQAYFVEFEIQAHELIAKGTTVNALGKLYLQLLREQFGRSVTVPDAFQWEWLTIPHIYRTPFYCYAYSFGNLFVLSLFQRYLQEGQAFIPKYVELLQAGGSKGPNELLSTIGVNMQSDQFWQAGFDRIKVMVQNLEQTLS